MPCCVSGCAGSPRLVQFPADGLFRRRWRDAIVLATGTGLDLSEDSLELCEVHFEKDPIGGEDDQKRYQEPTRFSDRTGKSLELGSCRLCHRIEEASQLYSSDGTMADVTIDSILEESVKVKRQQNDLFQLICGECLVQVGMVLTIQRSFLIKGEPTSSPLMEVTSCGLCHRNESTSEMCFLDDYLVDDVSIGSILPSQTNLARLICQECLARIDLMHSIQNFFVGKDREFRSWKREELSTIDLDCDPELVLEVKVEPVEVQQPAKKRRKRRPKGEIGPKEVTEKLVLVRTKKCYLCKVIFDARQDLIYHLAKNHKSESGYECKECDGKKFGGITAFNFHLSCHDAGERPLKCSFCSLRYSTTKGRLRHENRDHGTSHPFADPAKKWPRRKAQCDICGKIYSSAAAAQRHKLKDHELGTIAQCNICNKKFARTQSLDRHMLIHTGEFPHKCTQCEASFRQSTDLSKHVLGDHQGKTPYDCKQCNVPLATKTEYYRHRKMAHSTGYKKGNIRYKCLLCETTCSNAGELRTHIAAQHEEGYPYLECPECPTLKLTCIGHSKVHRYNFHPQNETTEVFICETCGKEFDKKLKLQRHTQSVHPTKSYPCEDCGKTFRLHSTYYRHKATHTGIRKMHPCTICDKTFTQAATLRNHIRNIHTFEKPFPCENCFDSFPDSSALNRHRAKKHPQNDTEDKKPNLPKNTADPDKTFPCTECGKTFRLYSTFYRHKATHTGIRKMHPCTDCEKTFTQAASLRNHVRNIHTQEKPFRCDECGDAFPDGPRLKRHRAKKHAQNGVGRIKEEPEDPLGEFV